MESGVYEIVNSANGKRYVGSAKNITLRFRSHRSRLNLGNHHSRPLQNAWLKYGATAFTVRTILLCDPADLLVNEQRTINALAPEYNVCPTAGNTLGRRHSPETRALIAAKAVGRVRSAESVEAGAAKRRGVKVPAMSARMMGNQRAVGLKHTDEWKAANSLRNLGRLRPKDEACRAKIAASLRGRKATPEARANQSAAQRGRKRGPYKREPA